jgi:hypothetical protein
VLSECHPFAHTDSKRCFQGLLVIVRGAEKWNELYYHQPCSNCWLPLAAADGYRGQTWRCPFPWRSLRGMHLAYRIYVNSKIKKCMEEAHTGVHAELRPSAQSLFVSESLQLYGASPLEDQSILPFHSIPKLEHRLLYTKAMCASLPTSNSFCKISATSSSSATCAVSSANFACQWVLSFVALTRSWRAAASFFWSDLELQSIDKKCTYSNRLHSGFPIRYLLSQGKPLLVKCPILRIKLHPTLENNFVLFTDGISSLNCSLYSSKQVALPLELFHAQLLTAQGSRY